MLQNSKWAGRDQNAAERVTPERAQVLSEEAAEAVERGEYAEARDLYHHCARIYHKLKRHNEEAGSLVIMAKCSEWLDDQKESRAQYEEAIAIYRYARDADGLSEALQLLGAGALNRENYSYAAKLLRESADICEKEGFRERYAVCLYLLAVPELNSGEPNSVVKNESYVLQAKAEHAARHSGDCLTIAEAAVRLAESVAISGELPRAQRLLEDSVRHYRNTGYLPALAPVLLKVGWRSYIDGSASTFASLADSLKTLYSAARLGRNHAPSLREMGSLALRLGDAASAYALFKESMGRSSGLHGWRDRAASYAGLGCVATLEQHDDLARSLFEKAFTSLKEGASGSELLERTLKLCRRIHHAEDLNAAALYYARCAVLARSLGEITYYIQAMYYRGCVANQQGDYAAANRHLEECLIYYGEAGPVRRLGRTLTEKGAALFAVGDENKGRSYIRKGLDIARAEKDDVGVGAALTAVGNCAPFEFDGAFEAECLIECDALSTAHENRYPQRAVAHHLGDVSRRRGELNDASRLYLKCVLLMAREGRLMAATAAIEGIAIVASDVELYRESVYLLSRANALRRRTGSVPKPLNGRELDAATSAARSALNPFDFAAAWAEGEQFGIRDLVRVAWSIVDSRGTVVNE